MPWKITIAEDMRGAGITASVADGGQELADSQWDARLCTPWWRPSAHGTDHNVPAVAGAISESYNDDAFRRVICTETMMKWPTAKPRGRGIMPGDITTAIFKKRTVLGRPWCSRRRASDAV
jgi:1,4-alpha-glucan branching enzyme